MKPVAPQGGVAALNVYKKVAIIRRSTDVLSYEDVDGNVKTITDLHLAAAETTVSEVDLFDPISIEIKLSSHSMNSSSDPSPKSQT
jgi:hypothetical protein